MRKIILLIIASLLPVCGFSQLVKEGFETGWTLASTGTAATGWFTVQNGIGPNFTWVQGPANSGTLPAFEGERAAYLQREQVATGLAEDYLVTPAFTVPADPEIHFYSRLTQTDNQGSIYKVLILNLTDNPGADLNTPASYTELQSWTETEINPVQDMYYPITVEIPAEHVGDQVRIAFMMANDFGDRWLIDNAEVVKKCVNPTTLTATNIGLTTADLSWENPSGSTSWEIEIIGEDDVPTGVPTATHTGALPYQPAGLTESTCYKYYVRALCEGGGKSEWVGAYYFCTTTVGGNCTAPLVVTALPYNHTSDTAIYGNDYTGLPGTSCGTEEAYLGGSDVVYAFTPDENMVVEMYLSGLTGSYASMFVYTSCANIGTECFGAAFNMDSTDNLSIDQIDLAAGITYYIVIDTGGGTTSTGYTLNLKKLTCPFPMALQASEATVSSAHISWVEIGTATTWEYVMQPPGTGSPTGAGIITTATEHNPTGLPENTYYEFYVRASCGVGDFSQWVGPLVFKTLCSPLNAPFTEGFNSDSTTEDCWIIKNVSGTAVWNLDHAFDTFEGDEVAVLDPEFMAGNTDWLITPAINIAANQRLRFHQKVSGFWGSNVNFKVLLSTTGVDAEDFTIELLPSASYNNNGYVEYEIFLNTIPAGTIYIAWVFEGGAGSLFIDNVIIDPIPPCPNPEDLTASGFTTTSAVLSWKPGFTETSWEVVIQAPDAGVPTAAGTPTTLNPYPANGLTANTAYEYYIRATCGVTNGNSDWIGPFAFRTACTSFDVPFHEGFNSDSESVYCWKILDLNGNPSDKWVTNSNNFVYEGDRSASFVAEFSNLNDDWLISPGINLTGNERLTYQYRVYQNIYPVTIKVLLSTTGTDPEDFTEVLVPVANYNNMDYTKKVIDLSAYTGTVYIAWQGPPSDNSNGMFYYLDDVNVEAIPACADPYDLVVDTTTTTSAKLSWTPGNGETQWEIVVKTGTSGPPDAPGIITSDNPYTIEGLESGTYYAFYIRSVCGGTNSIWNGPKYFTTVITNDECANAINVPVNPDTNCTLIKGGTLNGSTQSPQASTCEGVAMSDVWFEFTATAETHNITMLNVLPFENIHFGVYSGDCGSLVSIGCDFFGFPITLEGLTIGEIYKLRVYSTQVLQKTSFDICIRHILPPITVDNTTYTVDRLVKEVLINSDCAQVSNITYSTGTNFNNPVEGGFGPNGIAYFEKNGSLFFLENGIVLTTGNAMESPGPKTSTVEDGHNSWPGDEDLNAVVLEETGEAMDSKNATILEFDFVPLIDTMSFDFLFASEEYGIFQCDFSDAFAFLLTDSEGVTKNIALVPGTDSPVSVVTIRDKEYNPNCESVNPEYFGWYNGSAITYPVSPINYQGYTVPMTAQSTVVPNTTYHIKMVIADRLDSRFDSAIFLAGGSFNIGGAALGPDLTVADGTAICAGETHTILSGMSPDIFTFKWYKDDVLLEGETGATLIVSAPGTYKMEAQITAADCIATDSVIIEFYPPVEDIVGTPENFEACSSNGTALFNITDNNAVITGALNPDDLTITYHLTEADAKAGINALASPYQNTSAVQTIYVRVVYEVTGCNGILSFTLTTTQSPVITTEQGCENGDYVLEVIFDAGGIYNPDNTTISWTNDTGTVIGTNVKLIVENAATYKVTVTTNADTDCDATSDVIVTSTTCEIPKGISPNGDNKNDEFDLSGFDVRKLKIFNRYGQEVYSKNNYTKEWHGQGSNGDELPTGTYYYMIEHEDSQSVTGWVYINRQE